MAAALGAMVRTTGKTEKIRQGIKQRPGEISMKRIKKRRQDAARDPNPRQCG